MPDDKKKKRSKEEEDFLLQLEGPPQPPSIGQMLGVQDPTKGQLQTTPEEAAYIRAMAKMRMGRDVGEKIASGAKAGAVGGLNLISLMGGPLSLGSGVGLRAALASGGIRELLKQVALRSASGASKFAANPYIKGALTAGSAAQAYTEPTEDMGSLFRAFGNVASSRFNPIAPVLSTMQPGALRTGIQTLGSLGMNMGNEAGAQLMEGDKQIDPSGFGMGAAAAGGIAEGIIAGAVNSMAQTNKLLPREVVPKQIEKLKDALRQQKITPEEFDTFVNTLRNRAGAEWMKNAGGSGFTDSRVFDFEEWSAPKLDKINKMPEKTVTQRTDKANALRGLFTEWEDNISKFGGEISSQSKKLNSLGLPNEVEEAISPGQKTLLGMARAQGKRLVRTKDGKFVVSDLADPSKPSLSEDVGYPYPGLSTKYGKFSVDPFIKPEKVQSAIKQAESAFNKVGGSDTSSWVSEVKQNPEAAKALIEISKNPVMQVGAVFPEKDELIKTLKSVSKATDFVDNISKRDNLRLFNEHFADSPNLKAFAKKQFYKGMLDSLDNYKPPKPGSGDRALTPITQKMLEIDPAEFDKLFGEGKADAMKEVCFAMEEAYAFLAKEGFEFSSKEMMFTALTTMMIGGKIAQLPTGWVAPVGYGVVGAQRMASKWYNNMPYWLDKILENNGMGAKLLKRYWENPARGGEYLRILRGMAAPILNNEDSEIENLKDLRKKAAASSP